MLESHIRTEFIFLRQWIFLTSVFLSPFFLWVWLPRLWYNWKTQSGRSSNLQCLFSYSVFSIHFIAQDELLFVLLFEQFKVATLTSSWRLLNVAIPHHLITLWSLWFTFHSSGLASNAWVWRACRLDWWILFSCWVTEASLLSDALYLDEWVQETAFRPGILLFWGSRF